MQKEEKILLPYNNNSQYPRSPKEEEVPCILEEYGNSSKIPTETNCKDDMIKDELECILGFQDDQKFDGPAPGHMLSSDDWDDFMAWDHEFSNVNGDLKEEEEECDTDDDEDDDDEDDDKMKIMEASALELECDINYDSSLGMAVKREDQMGYFWEEKTISLNLNYQDVLDAWSDGRSPWADDYSLSTSNVDGFLGEVPVMEEEKMRREARVLRYKQKRQSRLFSKKIRYQVRKLNAEKRPRLKGRFVKRSTSADMR